MRVILDIPKENLLLLEGLASIDNRSRKKYMELVLISHSEQAEMVSKPDLICISVPQLSSEKEVKINQPLKQPKKIIYPPATNLDRTKYIPNKTEEQPKFKIKRTPANWVELRRECENAEDYNKWLNDLENDTYLTIREKNQIKATT